MFNNFNSKKYVLLVLIIGLLVWLAIVSLYNNTRFRIINKNTRITFDQVDIDLGSLKQGAPKTIQFSFKNTGVEPLIINSVEPSCGCTDAQWPKKPIKQGKEGVIELTYDAKTPGIFMKTIDVIGNFEDGKVLLHIKGMVIK